MLHCTCLRYLLLMFLERIHFAAITALAWCCLLILWGKCILATSVGFSYRLEGDAEIWNSSCDLTSDRWGPNGVEEFKKNLSLLFREICENLPRHCQVNHFCSSSNLFPRSGAFLTKHFSDSLADYSTSGSRGQRRFSHSSTWLSSVLATFSCAGG